MSKERSTNLVGTYVWRCEAYKRYSYEKWLNYMNKCNREAKLDDDFLLEMEQHFGGVNIMDDDMKIKTATMYLKDSLQHYGGGIGMLISNVFTTLTLELPDISDDDDFVNFFDGLKGWAKIELKR
uniref:Uncharacterized protein n=1 Tax=Lactuca sativa TaxID=4236 RepID=A0A9R1WND3_LACSA|nr:hypothetical protein LSAT_V11C100035630 [Lactuca sativa]